MESSDELLADINDLMQKCQVVQQSTPGMEAFLEDEDGEDDVMNLPDNADEVLASIQGLMAKCEVVQQTARDMDNDSFWASKMRQQELSEGDKAEDSDEAAS